jgi:hypothetical protein
MNMKSNTLVAIGHHAVCSNTAGWMERAASCDTLTPTYRSTRGDITQNSDSRDDTTTSVLSRTQLLSHQVPWLRYFHQTTLIPPLSPQKNCPRNFLIIKPTRCSNFSNLFWSETLHVSDSSSVHHHELFTVHSAMVYVRQVCRQLSSSSRIRMELQFHPDPAARKRLKITLYVHYLPCWNIYYY